MAVSGMFYPSDKNEIVKLINEYELNIKNDTSYISRLVIAPHAGYKYSGFGAYYALKHLGGKNIFIFAPAHKVYVEGIAISSYDSFETPFGKVQVNIEIIQEIADKFYANYCDEAFETEHAIEVQLPFLKYLKDDFNIIPILVGNCDPRVIYEIISYYYENSNNSFVISTDLTHFLTNEKAKKIDNITAQMIESNKSENFHREQACNASAICGAVEFSKSKNFSFIRLDMRNSSLVTKDTNNVVGYGSWMLYEGEKNNFIKKYYSSLAKEMCLNSIKARGNLSKIHCPAVFNEIGASFVTLEKNCNLRGCIGSIVAYRGLIDDLVSNAYMSAYKDPRFQPLKESEIGEIEIKISLLSEPVEIDFTDEEDLLEKIVQNKDGIIISDLGKRAVYLPSVWEQLPDKRIFLYSLKQKAGLSPEHFSNSFKAYRFYTEYI